MIKWAYFARAAATSLGVLLLLNDLRVQMKRASVTVNDKLPRILAKTESSAETLSALSADVKQLRDLAGLPQGPRDATLAAYADRVLDAVEASGGVIGLKPLVGGGGRLKDPQPAKEWVASARKEAVWLTFRADSRKELLERLCRNKFGSDWMIQFDAAEPVTLASWASQKAPPTEEGQ